MKKKVILTVSDILVVLIALLWVMWLCFYYASSEESSFTLRSPYAIFERDYLVPLQIFGITIALTVATAILYRMFRRKKLIGKKYILLAVFNTVPFWVLSVLQIYSMVNLWDQIYR